MTFVIRRQTHLPCPHCYNSVCRRPTLFNNEPSFSYCYRYRSVALRDEVWVTASVDHHRNDCRIMARFIGLWPLCLSPAACNASVSVGLSVTALRGMYKHPLADSSPRRFEDPPVLGRAAKMLNFDSARAKHQQNHA